MNNLVFNPAQMNGFNNWNIPMQAQSKSGEPIKVNGEEGARSFQMLPNSRVVLFDANEPIFYLRETDGSNNPLSFKTYRYEEVELKPQVNLQYVTLDEFNKFKEELLNGKYIWTTDAAASASTSSAAEYPTNSAVNGDSKSESVNGGNAPKSGAKKSAV